MRTRWLLVLTAGVVLLPAPVAADDWGTGSGPTGPNPDRSSHSYCWGPGFDSDLESAVTTAENGALDPTDATVAFIESCVTEEPFQTDVRWLDADLGETVRGRTSCVVYSPNGVECDRFNVTLNPAVIDVGEDDELDRSKTACHELGHSVGLSHGAGGGDGGTDDCMISGERPSSDGIYDTYSTHHTEHINAWF